MDKEYVMQIADTIRQQLLATTPMNVICSWGALHGFFATVHKGMATLMFKVNGRLFKGNVLISYNEMDYYEIYLKDANGIRLAHPEVYFDQLRRHHRRDHRARNRCRRIQRFLRS